MSIRQLAAYLDIGARIHSSLSSQEPAHVHGHPIATAVRELLIVEPGNVPDAQQLSTIGWLHWTRYTLQRLNQESPDSDGAGDSSFSPSADFRIALTCFGTLYSFDPDALPEFFRQYS